MAIAFLHDLNLAALFCDHLVLFSSRGLVASRPMEALAIPANLVPLLVSGHESCRTK